MTEFKLPELGENIDQGDLVRLMISPGTTISEGQAVMELETDKAVVEVPSTVSGVVKEIRVKEGEKIKVGQVIFTFENGAGGTVVRAPSPVKESAKEPKAQQAAASASGAKATPVEATSSNLSANSTRESGALLARLQPPVRPNSNCLNSEKIFPKAISCAS